MNAQPRIAIVTGAGSGIGEAISLALMQDGWTVALAGRRRNKLDAVAARGTGRSLVVPTDVQDPAAIRALFAEVMRHSGRLDLLVNNAGIGHPTVPLEDLPLDTWRAVVETNLTAAFLCTQEAFRIMKSQSPRGGRIINNGSISAYTPRPLSIGYTATKHAISGLTKSTALDGRGYDIACGQIDIGNAETPMTTQITEGALQPDGSRKPEPYMAAEDVGRAVVYMASLPLNANVLSMTVMSTKMPYVGRG